MYFKIILVLTLTKIAFSNDIYKNVLFKKSLESQPEKQILNKASRLGEPVMLECGTEEHELLKKLESTDPSMPILVNWFKHYSPNRRSDKPIYAKYLANNIDYAPHVSKDFENRIQVVDKINLNITSLRAVDEALYECRLILFDKAYADSLTGSMFYLQVQIAPEFEYPSEDIVYFKPNVPIRLYCYAKGKPMPSITWYKNGKFIEANTSVLQDTLSDNEISDIFEYKCIAQNDVGLIEHTTKVIRSGSLFFTEPLKNLTITEGTILNWPCLAQSNTEITYKWFKDSISVESHLFKWSDRGALFQDGMLYLLETYRTDSGFYECHAFTSNKRIITSAYLNVLYGPEIEPFPSPFYAFENSKSIVIDCIIRANPSISTLEWFKDQYLISNTDKYQILANNSLMIKNPSRYDQGDYYCVCNNTIKKSFSKHVKFELIDARRFEKISHTTSNNHYSLPCVTFKKDYQLSRENVQWFKINSKLPLNRYKVDSNGSLILENLRSTDSGFYYCRLKELPHDFLLKNKKKILIKLSVKKNRTSFDSNFSSENEAESTEIPMCPQNVKINQSINGILVAWTYPQQTPIEIEYFQIYFRVLNDQRLKQDSKKVNYEWKTTEPINFDTYKYLIDDSELEHGKYYEIQLVSFSSFSKSLPTENYRFKYQPKNDQNLDFRSSVYSINPTTSSYIRRFSLNSLNNLSQLDLILAAIFLILLCVLIISIIACVLFRQSEKSGKKNQKGDSDDWGFQSSAATTTFLSSSSSEKSTSLDSFSQKNKLFRHPEIEYNLNKNQERKFLNDNVNILKNETNVNDEEEDMFDDGDYYYAKPKFQTNTLKSRNFSYQSNSTTTGISSNPIDSSRSASSTGSTGSNNQKSEIFHSPNLINTSDATSSGITSASVTSSLINSDDNNDDISEKSNEFSINKIKYNAKTNILSTQDAIKSGKMYKPGRKIHERVLIEDNYSKILKSSLNRKQIKELNDCVNEYSGLSLDVDASNSNSGKKNWNEVSPAKSNCSIEINDARNPVPPFPTSHFKEKLPLDSSSSLTMVSRLPTSSFSYISHQEAKKILSSESSSSSSSSGCSSMNQQACINNEVGKFCTLVNDKNLIKSKKKNVNFVNQRNSVCVSMDSNSKYSRPIEKKDLIYSTNFKPVLKSINSVGNNLTLDQSPKKYHTSTFKPKKIDYV